MPKKEIEVELRAIIKQADRLALQTRLEKLGRLQSHTKRLSVMYFGMINKKNIDIRVRITNGQSEIVMKYGKLNAADRLETSQEINKAQFIGFTKMFSQLNFKSKIGEREIFNYILPNKIIASLVLAGEVCYLELEKMSTELEKIKNVATIKKLADKLGVRLVKSEKEYNNLCSHLDEQVDWPLKNAADFKKLEKVLKKY